MLVLSRKYQETVVIGGAKGFQNRLKVTVLGITGGRVRLGFEVDSSIPVHRGKIGERIQNTLIQANGMPHLPSEEDANSKKIIARKE